MTEKDRPYLIDYGRRMLADMVPYDDPHYEEKLQRMAEAYAEAELSPDPIFEGMCNWCDDMKRQQLSDNISKLRIAIATETNPILVDMLKNELAYIMRELEQYR